MRVLLPVLAFAMLLAGCSQREEFAPYDNTEERKAFFERFNRDTREQLAKEAAEVREALAGELDEGLRKEKEQQLSDLERRQQRPDYFEFLSESDLPSDLAWERGMDEPEIGSDEAKKGGTYHTYFAMLDFPPTIRHIGKEANNGFRSYHYDDIELAQVGLHPNTMGEIPGLCDRWAVAEDGQSVYFHIDDEARWSDGLEVTSEDWVMAFYMYLSPYLTEAYYRHYASEQFWGIATYGDDYFCIRNSTAKPLAAYYASATPVHREFFREFGPDFEERYNWRPRPTTGAYVIKPEDIVKGRSITMTRVKDWWAKDRKYYRNRFNPDRIEFRLYRDPSKIFELFMRGDLDLHLLNNPKRWYEDTEKPVVFKGYIERATFYNECPRPSWGLYFNTSLPMLDNLDVRIGLCHATNWEKVIELDLRGDAERKNVVGAGYGEFSPPHIKAREFSVKKARAAFARAGFTKKGDDGILQDDKGRRLSFTVNYVRSPFVDPIMLRLKEEAKKAGVEYKLEGMDSTASFQKVSRKEHEIGMMGWVHIPPRMDYYQYYHSKEAFEPGTRKPRPMTNNITVYANPELDPVLERNRAARSWDEVKETAYKIEETVHDAAVWCPGFDRTFYRVGYWRWIRWPDDFNVRLYDEPEPAHVLWIDEERKAETLRAMREGIAFEEVNRVFERFRSRPEALPTDEPREGNAEDAGPDSDSGKDDGSGEGSAPENGGATAAEPEPEEEEE